ncbi:Na+/H+ antiporter NhaA [Sunxiuqinia sp. A32]|uniref:Na+/H+ antiporter NhaA n=1 Tax=Sunxiuqinia sp. A32 TaxID=3461496 RepID=UPI004045F8E9
MNLIPKPVNKFIHQEASSSILLLGVTILTLLVANIGFYDEYYSFLHEKITFAVGDFHLSKSLTLWINDGLMAIFFFVIGLEIKREILVGELSNFKKASLPVFAAIGGMLFPIIIFLAFNPQPETQQGWAIPMATDIAFTLGILKLLGKRVPYGLKIFLTAFAIVDDLGAIIIIAFFYSASIKWNLILIAFAIFFVLLILSHFRKYSEYLFFVAGIIIWVLFLKSGIHATLAGVLIAFAIPIRKNIKIQYFQEGMDKELEKFRVVSYDRKTRYILTKAQLESVNSIESLTEQIQSPVQNLENKLHGWVAFLIMPVFAFANAGVLISAESFSQINFSLVIAASLILGNLIGIGVFSYLALKLKIAELPKNTSLRDLIIVGILGGVGFTMSLFITNLSFEDQLFIDASKIGILIGSLVAGIAGYLLLRLTLKEKKEN